MKQPSLTDGFGKFRRQTRKERFLENMESILPWQKLAEAIEPFYPNPQSAGRRPVGIERMLGIHCLQHGFNLPDPAAEEALYDSRALRVFASRAAAFQHIEVYYSRQCLHSALGYLSPDPFEPRKAA